MAILKYTVIKNKKQYKEYCMILEKLVFNGKSNKETREEMALLTLLVEKWDADHHPFYDLDPIQLLISLMAEHKMKAKDLSSILQMSKGYVSDIIHYRKGLSKQVIRKLSEYFKVSQEAFNRSYKLKSVSLTIPVSGNKRIGRSRILHPD